MASVEESGLSHTVRVTLRGKDNDTYTGTIVLRNLTALLGIGIKENKKNMTASPGDAGTPGNPEDPSGASYYVIAVVLVYGMSIVMLIASHIKRKHQKLVEDRQIHKYLQEFQIVQERSSRDSYRTLKKSIMAKLNMAHKNPTYKTLSQAILPMMAVAMPTSLRDDTSEGDSPAGSIRQAVLASAFRPVLPHGARQSRRNTIAAIALPTSNSKHSGISSSRSFRGDASRLKPPKFETSPRESPEKTRTQPNTIEEVDETCTSPPISDKHARLKSIRFGSNNQLDDRYYYKPISVSKACRVYEIPKGSEIKPGGVHVSLHKMAVFKPEDSTGGGDSHVSHAQQDFANNRAPGLVTGTDTVSIEDPAKHKVISANRIGNEIAIIENRPGLPSGAEAIGTEGTNISPEQTGGRGIVSRSDGEDKPVQTADSAIVMSPFNSLSPRQEFLPHRVDRHSPDANHIDLKQESEINDERCLWAAGEHHSISRDKANLENLDRKHYLGDKRPTKQAGKTPNTLTPVGVYQSGGRNSWCSPIQINNITQHQPLAPPPIPRASTFSNIQNNHMISRRSRTESGDSASFCSDISSSDSDDVWLTMQQHQQEGSSAPQTDTPVEFDDEPEYQQLDQSGHDLSLRSLRSSPLLTPKDARRTDQTRRISPRSIGSHSESPGPAYAPDGLDTEKLLHQVTSL